MLRSNSVLRMCACDRHCYTFSCNLNIHSSPSTIPLFGSNRCWSETRFVSFCPASIDGKGLRCSSGPNHPCQLEGQTVYDQSIVWTATKLWLAKWSFSEPRRSRLRTNNLANVGRVSLVKSLADLKFRPATALSWLKGGTNLGTTSVAIQRNGWLIQQAPLSWDEIEILSKDVIVLPLPFTLPSDVLIKKLTCEDPRISLVRC